MRALLTLLLLACSAAAEPVASLLDPPITLPGDHLRLSEVLAALSAQTGMAFERGPDDLVRQRRKPIDLDQFDPRLTLPTDGLPLSQVLARMLAQDDQLRLEPRIETVYVWHHRNPGLRFNPQPRPGLAPLTVQLEPYRLKLLGLLAMDQADYELGQPGQRVVDRGLTADFDVAVTGELARRALVGLGREAGLTLNGQALKPQAPRFESFPPSPPGISPLRIAPLASTAAARLDFSLPTGDLKQLDRLDGRLLALTQARECQFQFAPHGAGVQVGRDGQVAVALARLVAVDQGAYEADLTLSLALSEPVRVLLASAWPPGVPRLSFSPGPGDRVRAEPRPPGQPDPDLAAVPGGLRAVPLHDDYRGDPRADGHPLLPVVVVEGPSRRRRLSVTTVTCWATPDGSRQIMRLRYNGARLAEQLVQVRVGVFDPGPTIGELPFSFGPLALAR
jgi:hypothetical protein